MSSEQTLESLRLVRGGQAAGLLFLFQPTLGALGPPVISASGT
ncbi:MAG: hypothetical protein ACO394_09705 [Blastocatellia bacterium]